MWKYTPNAYEAPTSIKISLVRRNHGLKGGSYRAQTGSAPGQEALAPHRREQLLEMLLVILLRPGAGIANHRKRRGSTTRRCTRGSFGSTAPDSSLLQFVEARRAKREHLSQRMQQRGESSLLLVFEILIALSVIAANPEEAVGDGHRPASRDRD